MQPILILTFCALTLCGTGAAVAGDERAAPDHLHQGAAHPNFLHHSLVPKSKTAKAKPQAKLQAKLLRTTAAAHQPLAAPVIRQTVPDNLSDTGPGVVPEAALPHDPHEFSTGDFTLRPVGVLDLTTRVAGH